MTIRLLTRENFQTALAEGGVVVVDVTAATCGACKTFDPVFSRVAERHPEIVFAQIDAGTESGLVSELNINHIPCLMIYRDEFVLFKQPGNFTEEQVEELVTTAVNLDMERLRASLSDDEKQQDEQKRTETRAKNP
jgi:thioredoxin 1